MPIYSTRRLKMIFLDALGLFNDYIETDICEENVYLEFFTPSNGVEVYERFCTAHFTKHLSEPYLDEGYFEEFAAQAFVNEKEYGVLIRADLDFPKNELFQIFAHEIAHLFCTRNETDGGNFFEKYCMGSGPEDGMINAGYAIWREAIADIIADNVLSDYARISLADESTKETIDNLYTMLSPADPDSKMAMSLIISYVMLSKQMASSFSWPEAELAIKDNIQINDVFLLKIFEMVFRQLHKNPLWKITPEFITDLGEAYLSLIAHKMLKDRLFQ